MGTSYLAIPTFSGYRLGSDGSVWSQWVRGRWRKRLTTWRQLKTPPDNHGYPNVNLYRVGMGGRQHFKVHCLIAHVFLGPRPAGLQIRHLNGNRADNRVENLAYGTAAENCADTSRHGRSNRGTRCPSAKLDDLKVAQIRRRVSLGEKQKDMATEFGVTASSICAIVKGRTWAHNGVET